MVEILLSICFIHLNWWSNDTNGYFAGFAVFLEHRRVLQKCHFELCVCTKIFFKLPTRIFVLVFFLQALAHARLNLETTKV